MHDTLPDRRALKAQARRLRAQAARNGRSLTHSRSLALIARRYGFRNWNTLRAAAAPPLRSGPVLAGDRVQGAYLGRAFVGLVEDTRPAGSERWRIVVRLDTPVDAAASPHFQALRRRISATVDDTGVTAERLLDGTPQLTVRRVDRRAPRPTLRP